MALHYIAFEGYDNSGKSSTMRAVADELIAKGLDVYVTREPGGTPDGEKLRDILFQYPYWEGGSTFDISLKILDLQRTILRDQIQEWESEIEEGKDLVVLSDRSYITTLLLQSGAMFHLGNIEESIKARNFVFSNLDTGYWRQLDCVYLFETLSSDVTQTEVNSYDYIRKVTDRLNPLSELNVILEPRPDLGECIRFIPVGPFNNRVSTIVDDIMNRINGSESSYETVLEIKQE